MSPGEKLRRQRKTAERAKAYAEAMAALRAVGACCGTCRHFGRPPMGMSGRICELDSDSDGHVERAAHELCPRHQT